MSTIIGQFITEIKQQLLRMLNSLNKVKFSFLCKGNSTALASGKQTRTKTKIKENIVTSSS
jgi:hypothetical protein